MIEKQEEIFVGLVDHKGLIVNEKKVLFVKGIGAEKWDLPGGRLHKGEAPLEGLKRELKEEINCDCEIGKAVYSSQMYHSSLEEWAYFITYEAVILGDQEISIPDDELEAYAWFDKEEISSDMTWEHCAISVREYFK